jgi:hypothetical protein
VWTDLWSIRGWGILVVLSALSCFQEGRCSCSDEQFVRARYLVVSRGELLMVVRLAAHHHVPTSSFKVFRMIIIEPDDNGEDADEYTRTWIELGELCGRMLFVGRERWSSLIEPTIFSFVWRLLTCNRSNT